MNESYPTNDAVRNIQRPSMPLNTSATENEVNQTLTECTQTSNKLRDISTYRTLISRHGRISEINLEDGHHVEGKSADEHLAHGHDTDTNIK